MVDAADLAASPGGSLSELRENPPRGVWDFFVRAWRPSASWVCVLILLTRGVGIPAGQLALGVPVEPVDWTALSAMAAVLGLGALRSFDKSRDTTI